MSLQTKIWSSSWQKIQGLRNPQQGETRANSSRWKGNLQLCRISPTKKGASDTVAKSFFLIRATPTVTYNSTSVSFVTGMSLPTLLTLRNHPLTIGFTSQTDLTAIATPCLKSGLKCSQEGTNNAKTIWNNHYYPTKLKLIKGKEEVAPQNRVGN